MNEQADHRSVLNHPSWMTSVLRAAAVYNLIWGLWAIVAPLSFFRLVGVDPLPAYPELWQCIGMIVGVYGVGYWIAATNPYRHWPIVLVGLLGKVFGPIGFVQAVLAERFPPLMGITILTNDLIWWAPFGLILLGAARAVQTERALSVSDRQPVDQNGRSFDEIVASGRSVVVFLRHSGCTFCRETLAMISRDRSNWEEQGGQLVFVHMDDESAEVIAFFAKYGLEDIARVSDPGTVLYQRFGLAVATAKQVLGPTVWQRGLHACVFAGHGVGRLRGNGFQLAGLALIEDGETVAVQAAESAAERPDLGKLIATRI